MSNNNWIYGCGPSNAKLMVIGEAPGAQEEIQGRPLVGPAGELVTELLEVAGLPRSKVYLTNVVKVRPPQNDLERLIEIDNPDRDYISTEGIGYRVEDFLPLLWQEIEVLRPNCILGLGSLALKILTGREGIKNWRGSILPCVGSGIKTICTIHPAALFERNYGKSSGQGMFSWKQKSHIQFDFIKAVRESNSPSFPTTDRTFEIIRSSNQLEQFFRMYKDYGKVYVDTEVYKSLLVCIGFAFTRYHGCSVPLIDLQSNGNYKGIPQHELVELWDIIYEKLADPNLQKAGQNFKSDKVYWLEPAGFVVNNFTDDGMFKIHTLSPELDKSLAFQQSIYTNEPYHKSEGKEYNPYKDSIDDLLRYNAKDCVINCECIEEMDKDLKELGLEEFYNEYVMGCYLIYEGIEKRGIKLDLEKKKELSEFYDKLLKEEYKKRLLLYLELGITLDTKDGDVNYDSPQQVSELIYEKLRCPRRKDTSDEVLTALVNNNIKDPRKKAIVLSILASRSIDKIKTVYCDFQEDYDGRARCTSNQVGTETGRTSTKIIRKPLRNGKWGVPYQTIPRPDEFGGRIREMYIPDSGKIFIEADQSQAEARIVALLANDLKLLTLFDRTDVHKLTASFCYSLTTREPLDLLESALNGEQFDFFQYCTDEMRQIGKNTRHGLGYDLGEEGLSIKMKISLYRAKICFQKVHEMSPNIKGVYHEAVQEALANNSKILWTPFGRRREFFNKWGKELFRESYAHIPQSTIGDNTKRCLLGIKSYDWIEPLAEMHDGFLAQIPEGREKEAYQIIKEKFEQPIDFERCTIKRPPITIPVEFKIGESWGSLRKYKGE